MLGIFGHINQHKGGYLSNVYPEIMHNLDLLVEIMWRGDGEEEEQIRAEE
jgi:hypothetical protein